MYWWLLGFRGDEMDMPWKPKTITTRLLKYAGHPTAHADSGLTVKTLRPQTGDVLNLYREDLLFEMDPQTHKFKLDKDNKKIPILDEKGVQKKAISQHIFPIVETSPLPAKGEPLGAFTIYSVDGGSPGSKYLDGKCNGVHKSVKKHAPKDIDPATNLPTLPIGTHALPIYNWISLEDLYNAKRASMKPPIEPVRNKRGSQFPKVDYDPDPTPTGEFPKDPTSLDPQG
jgi:hypothetical protein